MSAGAPVVFLDTETTGLDLLSDEVWEFAGFRRDPETGTETALHLFIEHDAGRCERLPPPFLDDHRARYPGMGSRPGMAAPSCGAQVTPDVRTRAEAARQIAGFTSGAHLAGAVVSFDAARLELLLRSAGLMPAWHYHLVDVETLAAGMLRLHPPYDSDELSALAGVDPSVFERHTAVGDALWARAVYDAVLARR